MKILLLAALALVTLTEAKQGFSLWGCPNRVMNTIPYDSSMAPIHRHKIIYFDKTMNWIVSMGRTFSSSIPNFNCVNIANYGFDNQQWYEQSFGVGNQTGFLFTKVLYWDQAT